MLLVDKLLPVSNMASYRSEENVNLNHFQHQLVSQCWSVLQFCWDIFVLFCLADVIANDCLAIIWQMLLPLIVIVVDVKPLVL